MEDALPLALEAPIPQARLLLHTGINQGTKPHRGRRQLWPEFTRASSDDRMLAVEASLVRAGESGLTLSSCLYPTLLYI